MRRVKTPVGNGSSSFEEVIPFTLQVPQLLIAGLCVVERVVLRLGHQGGVPVQVDDVEDTTGIWGISSEGRGF